MLFSQKCVELIAQYEGFSSKPYLCPANLVTIGYGTTVYPNGKKVQMSDVAINKAKASEYLKDYLNTDVAPYLKPLLKVAQNQNQIDALGCLIYNIGIGNFKTSTLLKKINSSAPISEIEKWWLVWNKAKGKVLNGLVRRRQAEFALYNSK